MKSSHVEINAAACVGCGLCRRVCPAHNIALERGRARALSDGCIMCGQCSAVCPQRAISIEGFGSGQAERPDKLRLAPEDVLNVIRFRRSVRCFRQTPVPGEIIEQILEAGRLSHTARNAQDVSFTVLIDERARLEAMAVKLFRAVKPAANLFSAMARRNEIDEHFFFFNAPTVIVISAREKVNGVLAAQNMEFVAEAYGLGVLYSGFFTAAANASRRIRKALAVPRGKTVAMTLVLGYPDVRYLRSTPHRELDVRYM